MRVAIWVRRLYAALACGLLALACGLTARAGAQGTAPLGPCATTHWVGAWTADPSGTQANGFADETLRIVLSPHVGGARLRVHLSNRFGTGPVTLERATVGLRDTGAEVVPGSIRPLTFGRAGAVTIPTGGDVVSDPVALSFGAFQDLAVSLYAASPTGPATDHLIARERSYDSGPSSGDHTGDVGAGAFVDSTTTASFVDGVDALVPARVGAAVLFGDSITDGYESAGGTSGEDQASIGAEHRFPDYLARRLAAVAGGPALSVVNAGISGNRLLADGQAGGGGQAGASRIGVDVLGVPGVTDAIVLEGVNDIALGATADQVIAGLGQVVGALHAQGVRVLLGTILPAGTGLLNLGNLIPGFYLDSPTNAVRVAVNDWIRSGASGADGVVDFDAALRGQAQPNELDPGYDSGDHLHPSDAGYSRMADTVDLGSLRAPPCAPAVATRLRVAARVPSARHLRIVGSLVSAAADSCAGDHVTLRALHGGRSVLKRNIALTAACHFAATKPLATRGRIEVRVAFAGSPALLASHARALYVRAR